VIIANRAANSAPAAIAHPADLVRKEGRRARHAAPEEADALAAYRARYAAPFAVLADLPREETAARP